jgi:cysteine desulfurase
MTYFDWNATAPLVPSARNAWLAAVEDAWGNPSTAYRLGAAAKVVLEESREAMADLMGVSHEQVVFTSGATEANNAFIHEAERRAHRNDKIWISAVEHPSVREAAIRFWGRERVVQMPVTVEGIVDLNWLDEHLSESRPALISVMAVNNETGVIQPCQSILKRCKTHGVPFHSDAVQWFGKGTGNLIPWGDCAGISISAHKFGGPKGTGCLVLGEEWTGTVMQAGGGQEHGNRAGTEDVAGIAAMVAALRTRMAGSLADDKLAARDQFESSLLEQFPNTVIHGMEAPRMWNTSSVGLPDFKSARWIARLDKRGFQVSTGAACSAGKKGASAVMQAMGVDDDIARRTLRISAGWETDPADWDALLEALKEVHQELASEEPQGGPGTVIEI